MSFRSVSVRTVLAVLFGLFALLTIADRFALLELLLLRAGWALLFSVAQAIGIIGLGCILRGSREADPALDYIIGFPIFGTLLFLVGLVSISTASVVTVLALTFLAGLVLIAAGWKHERPVPTSSLSFIAVLVALIAGVVTALAPPTSSEEISSTLAIARSFVLEGRVVELPLLGASYLPLGIESADVAPIALLGATRGGIASHFLHLFAAIATTMLVFRRTESWLLTAAIVTTPALGIAAGLSLGDWPLVGLFVATYVALEREDVRTASASTAAGLLTSYLFLPFALLVWILRRRRPHWIALAGLVFFVRNAVLTGNPVAPFFTEGGLALQGHRAIAIADYAFSNERLVESLGAAIFALPFFGAGWVALACALVGIGLFLLGSPARLLVPYLVVSSITASEAVRRRGVALLLAVTVSVQTLLVAWVAARSGVLTLLTAATSMDDYMRTQRPVYASIAWINQALPPQSRTMIIGVEETYWFDHSVRSGAPGDAARVSHYLDLPTPEGVRERLREDGITHVAVITAENGIELTPDARKMLARMLDQYAATVTTRGNATLFTLR
jgi:hypothetical protein